MPQRYRVHLKIQRLLVIACALAIFIWLCVLNMQSSSVGITGVSFHQWMTSGFFSFESLVYLIVGSLGWLYARNRPVATLLLASSLAMMMVLAVETGRDSGFWPSVINRTSGFIALPLAGTLLLFFPRNHFSLLRSPPAELADGGRRRTFRLLFFLLALYIALFFGSGIAIASLSIIFLRHLALPNWLLMLAELYYVAGLFALLLTTLLTYYSHFSSTRERQQLRLFFGGVVVALLPLLTLNLLPRVLHLPPQYVVDDQYTAATIFLFPLALGYSILRYQILVFDTYVRRIVSYIVGALCIALLVYLVVAITALLSNKMISIVVIVLVAVVVAVLSPAIWWLAKLITDRLFFGEVHHYQQLIEEPALFGEETLDLDDASRLIVSAAVHTFEIPQVCFFVLDESSHHYRLIASSTDRSQEPERSALQISLSRILQPLSKREDWLEAELPAIRRVALSRRPMLLSEAIRSEDELPNGLGRFVTTESSLGHDDCLLVPVRARGQMIGLLVLGERADGQPYAGPDFEVAQLLLARYASVLEAARLYARANQSAALLNSLYTVSTQPDYNFTSLEAVARTYVEVAACAASVHAEIWMYNDARQCLQRMSAFGAGPQISLQTELTTLEDDTWFAWFFESAGSPENGHFFSHVPSCLVCLNEDPGFSFAWLPLIKYGRRVGVMVLAYPLAHFFIDEEMNTLKMFASQCAATFESVRMTSELRLAYERQKELDMLKDRFILTASHELRTPLTAVQGYIELLGDHRDRITAETREDFVQKARLSCEELSLMVENIMDAGSVGVNVAHLRMEPVELLEVVAYVRDVQQSALYNQDRTFHITIDPALFVLGDKRRLRQVVLNLVINAMRYSAVGTAIDLFAHQQGQQVCIGVRDYGLGVPPQDRERLFERFYRLERDINSPIRGAGLGLSICKQLIEAMGGRIWVESSGVPGEGSTFLFILQVASHDPHAHVAAMQLPTW